jgi:hypothetical protein
MNTFFEETDHKGICDVCNADNKILYGANPYWENGEVDYYACAKCKNKIIKEDAKYLNEEF